MQVYNIFFIEKEKEKIIHFLTEPMLTKHEKKKNVFVDEIKKKK